MMSFREYREPKHRLSDHLPWGMIVSPSPSACIILQKGGVLQTTLRFRGQDLATASPSELLACNEQLNNAFRRVGGDWSTFTEGQHLSSNHYPRSEWPTEASFITDEERAQHFASAGMQLESFYFLTLTWRLPSERASRVWDFLYEEDTSSSHALTTWRRHVEEFQYHVTSFIDIINGAFPVAEQLNNDETVTYLHNTISTRRHPVRAPKHGCYLDVLLPDEVFQPSELPLLGEHYLAVCTLQDFPEYTFPGVLDALNHLHIEYRWMTRWLTLDHATAKSTLKKHQRLHLRSQKGLHTSLIEQASGSESKMVDQVAGDNADDAAAAMRKLGSGEVSFGYLTTTFVVWDKNPREAQRKRQEIKTLLERKGFVVRDETFHAWQAWLGSLPGHVYAGVRRPILHTRNLADLIPSSAVWAGAPYNEHLARVTGVKRAHIYTTSGSTPFRLNTNMDDLGNTAIFGPPGSGKSTLLAVLGLQFLGYPGARVITFDVHRSSRAAALANGGTCYEPGNPNSPLDFQPLAEIHDPGERVWAAEFIVRLLELQKVDVTPEIKRAIDEELAALALEAPERRTMTIAANVLGTRIPLLLEALRPYTVVGSYGQIFDGQSSALKPKRWTTFEMSHLMDLGPEAVLPALAYLVHHIERWFDGQPWLLQLDECWKFMGHPWFADWFQKQLKTLRKKNVYVYFATQEVADLAKHAGLVSTVLSACPSLIFGADESATTPNASAVYRSIGLSDVEIGAIARARRKRDYYYRSPCGRRMFSLSLGPVALTFAGMSSPDDHRFLDRMLETQRPEDYALAMLEHRDVRWAVEELRARRAQALGDDVEIAPRFPPSAQAAQASAP